MKRMELLSKHRQASEAAVLQVNRKHFLGLKEEVQRIDREMKMREKYLVFEKTLFYGRLDKIQQRQKTLGLIKSPISRVATRSVQKRMQPRRQLIQMIKRPGAEIFLTQGSESDTRGVVLPTVNRNKDSSRQQPLNSSKYAPSWLELSNGNGKDVQKRVSARLLPSIEEKPEHEKLIHESRNGTKTGQYLPPIDTVQSANTPLKGNKLDSLERKGMDELRSDSLRSSEENPHGGRLSSDGTTKEQGTSNAGNGAFVQGTVEHDITVQGTPEHDDTGNVARNNADNLKVIITAEDVDQEGHHDVNGDNGDKNVTDGGEDDKNVIDGGKGDINVTDPSEKAELDTGNYNTNVNDDKHDVIDKILDKLSIEEDDEKTRPRTSDISYEETELEGGAIKDGTMRAQSAPTHRNENQNKNPEQKDLTCT